LAHGVSHVLLCLLLSLQVLQLHLEGHVVEHNQTTVLVVEPYVLFLKTYDQGFGLPGTYPQVVNFLFDV
jgi:protein involved in ribonucleotide reduction